MVKLFQFPSFEEWDKNKREFKQKIGEFTCVFRPTRWRLNSSITLYECAIACSDNPTNIYVHKVVGWSFECDSTDTELVKRRYEDAIREVQARWIHYIENNYIADKGAFCPEAFRSLYLEYISLRCIIVAAFCASNKKELSVEEINQLLETIQDGLITFVELPKHIDFNYLEQIVTQEYGYFKLCKDYEGIILTPHTNPTQLYFDWEIRNSTVLNIIKKFYNPSVNTWG